MPRYLIRALVAGLLLAVVGLAPVHAVRGPSRADGRDTSCSPSAAGRAFRNLPAPYAPNASAEIIHTRIVGTDFYVPRNYFRHPQVGCGVEEKGMLLRVLLPAMQGYTEANAPEIEGLDKPGWGRKMNILVQALGACPALPGSCSG